MSPVVVRCQHCDAVHFAVSPPELAGESLERYRYCARCGVSSKFMPSELRLDELTAAVPVCLQQDGTVQTGHVRDQVVESAQQPDSGHKPM